MFMIAERQAQKSQMEESEVLENARDVLRYCGVTDETEIGRIIQDMQQYRKRKSQNSIILQCLTLVVHVNLYE